MAPHPISNSSEGARSSFVRGRTKGLDDAIVELPAWIELARDHLTDDDWRRAQSGTAFVTGSNNEKSPLMAGFEKCGRGHLRDPRYGTYTCRSHL
jgi:hypothetical protein